MAVKNSQKALLKQLKKQVRLLARREEQAKNSLRVALQKIRKLGKTYKSKLAAKARTIKSKVASAQASTYAKAALDVERHIASGVEAKSRAIKSALAKVERKHAAKLTRSLEKKAKKAGRVSSTKH